MIKRVFFFFNRKKDISEAESHKRKPRRNEQINCKSILKMKLKEDKKKNGFRYSMFDPKRTVIILPDYYHLNNIIKNNKRIYLLRKMKII